MDDLRRFGLPVRRCSGAAVFVLIVAQSAFAADMATLAPDGQAAADHPNSIRLAGAELATNPPPLLPVAPAAAGDSNPANPANPASPANPDQIGQAPEDNSEQFLREEAILLKSGEWRLDISESYTIDENPFTQLAITPPSTVTAINSILRRRLLVTDVDVRLGITDRLQFTADLPAGWTNTQTSFLGSDGYSNSGGLGDATCALSYLLHKSCGDCTDPDIIVTGAVTAPTSNADFLAELVVTPNATLGQGLWAGSWNILFVQKYDPVIVFYGFGSRYTLQRDFDGQEVTAGAQYSYRFGVALAVSDRVTLSSTLMGAYITDARINGADVPGTNLEPVYLRFAATLQQCNSRICEPFVLVGLTSDAVNTQFGVVWTF